MDLNNTSTSHISEDTLELYSLRRIQEDALPQIEEHLLICHACQDSLEEIDLYIQAVMSATSATRQSKLSVMWPLYDWFDSLSRPALGLSLAAALALLLVVRLPQTEIQSVRLTATRAATDAHVPSSKIPRLQLVAQGLPETSSYQVDLVDATGKLVWQGVIAIHAEQLEVLLPSSLSAGRYWIRVYRDSSRRSLLREYGFIAG